MGEGSASTLAETAAAHRRACDKYWAAAGAGAGPRRASPALRRLGGPPGSGSPGSSGGDLASLRSGSPGLSDAASKE